MCFLFLFFYYVRSSVQLKFHAANIEASKFVCFLSFFLNYSKISQMLVVCICYYYNFHIFLSFASEIVARNTILLQRAGKI